MYKIDLKVAEESVSTTYLIEQYFKERRLDRSYLLGLK